MSDLQTEKHDEYVSMRNQGKTYAEIAEYFGVSRQAVHCSVNHTRRRKWNDDKYSAEVKYPALKRYMFENRITIGKLEKMIDMHIRQRLAGGNLTEHQKMKIAEVTGVSYFELVPDWIDNDSSKLEVKK